ncbi:MAG: hypothetical protein JSS09_02420 [Verrucomicrobia bacterium]|nr:hypothetical protein [Verrucomicrobiota bacterium]
MINSASRNCIKGILFGALPGTIIGAGSGALFDSKTAIERAKIGAFSGLLFTPAYTQAARYLAWNLKPLAATTIAYASTCNLVAISCVNDIVTNLQKNQNQSE